MRILFLEFLFTGAVFKCPCTDFCHAVGNDNSDDLFVCTLQQVFFIIAENEITFSPDAFQKIKHVFSSLNIHYFQ